MICLPDVYDFDLETNIKIEKYILKLKEKGIEHDQNDPQFRKDIPVPKTSMGSNLNFELSSEPFFNTNLTTEHDLDGREETSLAKNGGGMEMGEICSPEKVHIFKSETKQLKLRNMGSDDEDGDSGAKNTAFEI
jgi:hypothetical protein